MAYSAQSDIEDRFGVTNVNKWADLDDDADAGKIAARIVRAIAAADDRVNTQLRGGVLVVPLAEPPPDRIKFIAATLAGVWLYESRGVDDYDAAARKAQHALHFQRDEAMRELSQIRVGKLRIGLTMSTIVPQVVT